MRDIGAGSAVSVMQVVALLSAEGAYGGPTSVALTQCRALQELGHRPLLLAGWDGRATAPAGVRVERLRARKLSKRSFASLVSPALLGRVLRLCRTVDVAHVHLARDLLTLPAALLLQLLRVPLVIQTHGMVVPDSRLPVRVLDRLVMCGVLRRAARLIALTEDEREGLQAMGAAPERIVLLGNAAPELEGTARFADASPLVVYMSRLAERKRPVEFVLTAARVHARRADVRFEVWGSDEGQLESVRRAIDSEGLKGVCVYRGSAAMEDVAPTLVGSQVMVLPSFAEPYPMIVLECLAVGLPVVMTRDTGLSKALDVSGAALVTDGTVDEMSDAVLRILDHASSWTAVSSAALKEAATTFSSSTMAQKLAAHYRAAMSST